MLYPNAIVLGRTENHREGTVPLGTTLMTNPLMTIVPMQDFSLFADPEFPISFFLEYTNVGRLFTGVIGGIFLKALGGGISQLPTPSSTYG